ncbi:hypothetical protein [Micromonospora sp. Llam0]|uniref:hypothetical protein n=1 Tax=Micromonospora sp. Llam0 TaxID=2485143 RepID=UPI0011CE50FF|nr:hypothetical protein [Micromonospora sp. Llam0]
MSREGPAVIRWQGRPWASATEPIPPDAEVTFTTTWSWAELCAEFGADEALAIVVDRLPAPVEPSPTVRTG